MSSSLRQSCRRGWRNVRLFFEEFVLFLSFLAVGIREFAYKSTLPVTRRLFSRKPGPPIVGVKDIRANRIRLNIVSSYSSPFNVEEFEVEWAPSDARVGEWSSVGYSDLSQRTVARLKADTSYRFRVRSRSDRGPGGWCADVEAKTRQDPVEGGGHGPRYTWTQTATDVTISFEVPKGSSKREVKVLLSPNRLNLLVEAKKPPGFEDEWEEALLDGDLYGKVASFSNGSVWELVKDNGMQMLNITLEKSVASQAPKFDYWRSIQPGHPELEIDTHKIVSDANGGGGGGGMQMVQPGRMDPAQLRAMGMGQYAQPER